MKKIFRLSQISAVLIFVALMLAQSSSQPATAQQLDSSPTIPTCALYTVSQEPGHRSQLLAIDIHNKQSFELGEQVEVEIRGLAVNPVTSVLYAVSDAKDDSPGYLYRVDRSTGELTVIGPHGLQSITALAFRWSDATLWGWAKEVGLIKLNTDTGASEVQFASSAQFSGLTWANDGSVLYASDKSSLWIYRIGEEALERVSENLPLRTEAIEMRSDGVLVGIASKGEPEDTKIQDTHSLEQAIVFIYDPATYLLVSETVIPTSRHYPSFAGVAWSRSCGNPSQGGPADIIRSVTLDKTQVCPGEDILVNVEVVHPESPQGVVDIAIDGKWGNPQYLQFTGAAGERKIVITASTPEQFSDMEETSIEVLECGLDPEFLEVSVSQNPYQEFTVDFEVTNATIFNGQNPIYLWDFGDGATYQSDVPYASHSYVDGIIRDQQYTNFDATITLQREGLDDLILHKTLTVWNMYAFNKQKGTIQPPVESDERLTRIGDNWVGNYKITNLEDEALQFTIGQLTYQPCSPDHEASNIPLVQFPLIIEPHQESLNTLTLAITQVPPYACEIWLHLSGDTPSGRQVEVNIYFLVSPNDSLDQPETNEETLATLNSIVDLGLVPDPDYITDEDLYRLMLEGKISGLPSSTPETTQLQMILSTLEEAADCDGNPKTPDPIGCECMPGDPVPEKPSGVGELTCSASNKFVRYPAHLPNARKGDIVIVPGCGLIGGLLRQVTPPMAYAHTGIMTSDYYQITHSTAIDKRYDDNLVTGGLGGINPDVIKYGWPGVITQNIDQAFNGQSFTDPSGKSYTTVGFTNQPGMCEGDTQLTYPLVIKPPAEKDQSVRNLLHAAADIAATSTGHYRFYAYTDASIGFKQGYNAPSDSWYSESPGTVCSQFVWYSLKRVDLDKNGIPDIQLEGTELEEFDRSRSAGPDPYTYTDIFQNGLFTYTQDGLYLYTAEERKSAASWLHNEVYNQVASKNFGILAADIIADQLTNCFGFDRCDASIWEAGEDWQDPGTGIAVSPDNILFWDSPEDGGVYGYSERLVYRSGAWGRVYRWAPSNGTGTVTGYVKDLSNASVVDATVVLNAAGGLVTASIDDGYFEFLAVPEGSYEIVAQKAIGGIFYSSHSGECNGGVCRPILVTVTAGGTSGVELVLQPPPTSSRSITVDNNLIHWGNPGEYPSWDNKGPFPHSHGWYIWNNMEWGPFWLGYSTKISYVSNLGCLVDIFARSSSLKWKECVGDVCLVLDLTCSLQEDNQSVNISGTATLDADPDASGSVNITVGPDESKPYTFHATSSDIWGSDVGDLWLLFINQQQY